MKYLPINQIHHGDSTFLMPEIERQSVSLSFWSPPYFVGKEYEKGATLESWQALLKKAVALHFDALTPGGFLVINIADILCFKDESIPRFQAMNISRQKSKVTRSMVCEAKASLPEMSRLQLAALLGCSEQTIDRRLNGNNIRGGKYNAQTRVRLVGGELEAYAYESGLILYDKRLWLKSPAWANSRWVSNTLKAVSETEELYIFWKPGDYTIDRGKLTVEEWREWGSRQIWRINSVSKNDDHEAKFPLELAKRVSRLYTDPGDLVIDPFIGSGTTALAALALGRRVIGIEKELKYVDLARENIAEARRAEFQ